MPRYNLKVDDEVYELVRREAEAEDRSIGNMMLWLIKEALEARDERRAESDR